MKHAFAALLLLAFLVNTKVHAQTQPKFVTYVLAGKDMRKSKLSDASTAIYDKKKGYYLVNDTDTKTVYSLLLITPKVLKDNPDGTPDNLKVRRGTLPSLSTGHGVSIGDSERTVIKKIGKPTSREKNAALGELTLFYSYTGGRIYGWSYSSWYSFKKGKVAAIRLDLQKGKELAG